MHLVLSILSAWPFYHNYELICPLFSRLFTQFYVHFDSSCQKNLGFTHCVKIWICHKATLATAIILPFFYFTLHKNTPRSASVVHLAYLVDVCQDQDTVLASRCRNVIIIECRVMRPHMWLCILAYKSTWNSTIIIVLCTTIIVCVRPSHLRGRVEVIVKLMTHILP